ncbi:hypothetical protein CONLIGDRAFT_224529 [Coniochaeta ligniaria NRRL 30616]|uniref:Restriction endonuclease domain-containing protein n=1 Tax=Coniochaeta ligniaria NRRL 30616 TaxID=1408157 RepID=A0A1J7IXN7_9PEZI|nr:hypothetical protein CONLIGDRAFT_224529 [Coniochaeta ligniaria NRRL 30616]
MPSLLHEVCIRHLQGLVTTFLTDVASARSGCIGTFAENILDASSADVKLANISDKARRSPDLQFKHQDAPKPGIVIEVAYAEQGRDLEKMARQYIEGTGGDCKVVIGVDTPYHYSKSKDWTVSMWRTTFVHKEGIELPFLVATPVMLNKSFRTKDGSAVNQDCAIDVHLTDFAPDRLCQDVEPVPLQITFPELHKMASKALEARNRDMAAERAWTGGVPHNRAPRTPSPSDELRSDDEMAIRKLEYQVEEMTRKTDNDFPSPTSSGYPTSPPRGRKN